MVDLTVQRKGPITRRSILGTIESELSQIKQWADMGHYVNAAEHKAAAEALIELLEVSDCGSAGGHDRGQEQEHRHTLQQRFDWLRQNRNRHVNY